MQDNRIVQLVEKRKNFLTDVLLNLAATVAMSGVMQLLIYPYLSRVLGADEYGKFLTLIGISNIVATTLGNSLNNVRLLRETDYADRKARGDFHLLALLSELFVLILIPAVVVLFSEKAVSILLICVVSFLTCFRAYYSVGYRIILNYRKLLIQSLFYCAGGVFGLLLVRSTGLWQWPFIFAELAAGVYTYQTCGLVHEPWQRTPLLKDTAWDYGYLIFTTLVANAITYLDRLLLYPLLGGQNVSTYYTATFFGKTAGIILTPMAGVLLSYYAKRTAITRRQFWQQNSVLILFCAAFYFLTFKLSEPITGFLYPTLIGGAKNFLQIGNLSAIVLAASSIVQPSVLKFCKTVYQPIIQTLHLAAYIGFGLLFLHQWGLMGFCVAALLANGIKLILLLIVGQFSLNDKRKETAE